MMLSDIYVLDCPGCGGEGTVDVVYGPERQGDLPFTSIVWLLSDVVASCGCKLTNAQIDELMRQCTTEKLKEVESD